MNYFFIAIKSLISSLVLFLLTKLMGQRQVSQLSMFDYTVGITIGSIAAEMATSLDKDYFVFIIGMTSYALISILFSYITSKNKLVRRIITGVPIILIDNGKIIKNNLKISKLDLDELFQELRVAGYFNINEIEYAILESNGRISFMPKSKYKPLTKSNENNGLCINLVMDGEYIIDNINYVNKTKNWINKEIKKRGYNSINDIFLFTIDNQEKINIYTKNECNKLKYLQ